MKRLLVLVVMVIGCKGDKGIDNMPTKGRIPEVVRRLDTIAKQANAVFRDTKAFPIGTSAQLPVRNGELIAGGCCGSKSTGASVDNKCAVSTAWASDPVWKALSFSIDTTDEYLYKYVSTDGKSFVVTATGDLDCDAQNAVFTVRGTGDATVLDMPPAGSY